MTSSFFESLTKISSTKSKEIHIADILQTSLADIIYKIFNLANNYKLNSFLTDIKVLGHDFELTTAPSIASGEISSEVSIKQFYKIYEHIVSGQRYSKSAWIENLQLL